MTEHQAHERQPSSEAESNDPGGQDGPRIGVFAYNFPHKKTQDVLWRLWVDGYDVACVVAMDPVDLELPESTLRVKPRHVGLVHPRQVATRIGASYHVVQHNTSECTELLQDHKVEIGVIAGARILKGDVLDAAEKGIINLHPGLIPEVRGLDALKWALLEDQPLGVTAHLIDERVDAGRIVLREEITLYPDDSLIDLSLRLYQTELEILPQSINEVAKRAIEDFRRVGESECRGKMPWRLEAKVPAKLGERQSRLYDSLPNTDSPTAPHGE